MEIEESCFFLAPTFWKEKKRAGELKTDALPFPPPPYLKDQCLLELAGPHSFVQLGCRKLAFLWRGRQSNLQRLMHVFLKKPKFLKENFLKVWISNSESQGMEANLQSLWQENQIQLAKRQTPGDPENEILTQCTSKEEEHPVIECPPPSLLFCGKAWRGSKINNQIPKFWDEEQNHLLPHHLKKVTQKKKKKRRKGHQPLNQPHLAAAKE